MNKKIKDKENNNEGYQAVVTLITALHSNDNIS